MTAFRISRETRDRLDFYGVVVGVATQPSWLRWDHMARKSSPRKEGSPWEVKLYRDVPFPTINSESLAVGFGDTPDEAVARALNHPAVKLQSRLPRALWLLESEMRLLEGTVRWTVQHCEQGIQARPSSDDLDDEIPF